jgi:hypothetical protein
MSVMLGIPGFSTDFEHLPHSEKTFTPFSSCKLTLDMTHLQKQNPSQEPKVFFVVVQEQI